MMATVVDLLAYSERKRVSRALESNLVVMADLERADGSRAKGQGRLRVTVNSDNTWSVTIVRGDEQRQLNLEGTENSSAPDILREIVDWLVG